MSEPAAPPDSQHGDPVVERRAAWLLALLALLLGVAGAYLLYARGVFEATQQLVLVADDSEGVVAGMNLTFSGFAIGRVRRIDLSADGTARIVIDVPRKDAHWLRTSSVFTLSRGMLGNTEIRAYSGILGDPPLPDGATRKVLVGDATAEIPRLVSAARELVQHLTALAAPDAALAATLERLQSVAAKLDGPGGALGVITGNPADAARLGSLLERSRAVLSGVSGTVNKVDLLMARTDALVARADDQLLGDAGLLRASRDAAQQLASLLGETRASLKKVDALLEDAQAVAANARVASADLGRLRAEVDANLRKVEQLVDEVHRKWPFKRDTEVKLP